jgi:hypothetical protein
MQKYWIMGSTVIAAAVIATGSIHLYLSHEDHATREIASEGVQQTTIELMKQYVCSVSEYYAAYPRGSQPTPLKTWSLSNIEASQDTTLWPSGLIELKGAKAEIYVTFYKTASGKVQYGIQSPNGTIFGHDIGDEARVIAGDLRGANVGFMKGTKYRFYELTCQ